MKILEYNKKAKWQLLMLMRNNRWVPCYDANGDCSACGIDCEKLVATEVKYEYRHEKDGSIKLDKNGYHSYDRIVVEYPIQCTRPYTFEAELVYVGCYHGRSSFCFNFCIKGFDEYRMAMPDSGIRAMMEALSANKLHFVDGSIKGTWKWQKKGSNVSIVPVIAN